MVDLSLSSYDYDLPPHLIAQNPVTPRDNSRLLVVASQKYHEHQNFWNLPQWLKEGDLLVLNNTRVIPARLYGQISTGAMGEVLLLEQLEQDKWLTLVKPGKRFKIGSKIIFSKNCSATVIERDNATGGRILQFHLPSHLSFWSILENIGHIPFPPYVTHSNANPEQYQTIYAQIPGAIAAPTAGLHFTDNLFKKLENKGVLCAEITLHVGIGTFRPVETDIITDHKMHGEWIEISQETVKKIQETKRRGGRIFAVGTTVVRALEGASRVSKKEGKELITHFIGKTDIFIYPSYQWQIVDGLITNFHLPKSSLLMLVSALIGRERLLNLYQEAVQKQYRFYSFGDAMLILPEATFSG